MAVTIHDIYAPTLGFGWENLPTRYTKRRYLDIEDGLVTMPSGIVMGTGKLPNGQLVIINDKGNVCAQRWSSEDEMLAVDPFSKRVFTVPTTNDLKCNAREMVSAHIDIEKARLIDLSIMWTDHTAGECGFYSEDLSVGENPYIDRLNGSTLLGLTRDEAGNYVVGRDSILCRLVRYMSGGRFAFIDCRRKMTSSLLTDSGALTAYGRKILAWAQSLTPEQRQILSQ